MRHARTVRLGLVVLAAAMLGFAASDVLTTKRLVINGKVGKPVVLATADDAGGGKLVVTDKRGTDVLVVSDGKVEFAGKAAMEAKISELSGRVDELSRQLAQRSATPAPAATPAAVPADGSDAHALDHDPNDPARIADIDRQVQAWLADKTILRLDVDHQKAWISFAKWLPLVIRERCVLTCSIAEYMKTKSPRHTMQVDCYQDDTTQRISSFDQTKGFRTYQPDS